MSQRALLIDFGGTLDADGVPWVDRFFELYGSAGGAASRRDFQAAFALSDTALARLPGVTTFDYSDTVDAQADLLIELLPDGDRMSGAALRETFVDDARHVADRNRPVLAALSEQFALGIVSNFQGNLGPCLDELELGSHFDVLVDSEVVGYRKPDRRIFEHAAQQLDCKLQECWMIGDSPPNDIAAAAVLGMRTCWIAPAARAVNGTTPTARVERFDQVVRALATS